MILGDQQCFLIFYGGSTIFEMNAFYADGSIFLLNNTVYEIVHYT